MEMLRADGRGQPLFRCADRSGISDAEREVRLSALAAHDRSKEFIANVLAYGVCGLMIASCLAIAEPLTQRNYPSVLVNGSVAALLGLLGGLAAALLRRPSAHHRGQRGKTPAACAKVWLSPSPGESWACF